MLRSYRSIVIAIGLIVFPLSGQAQQETSETERGTQQEQRPTEITPVPLPIVIVDDETKADARERQEAEAREREIADLAAQQGMNAATQAMNNATQRMAKYSFWSTVFVGVGTVLLIANLWLMGRTNKAAVEAVNAGREANSIAIEARRAWLTVTFNANWVEIGDRNIIMNGTFIVKNIGKEYARNIVIEHEIPVFRGGIEGRLHAFWMKHRQKIAGKPSGGGASLLPQETMHQNTHLSAGMDSDRQESSYRITPVVSVRYAPPQSDRWFVTERSFKIWLRVPGMQTQKGEFLQGSSPQKTALGNYSGDNVRVTALESGETR